MQLSSIEFLACPSLASTHRCQHFLARPSRVIESFLSVCGKIMKRPLPRAHCSDKPRAERSILCSCDRVGRLSIPEEPCSSEYSHPKLPLDHDFLQSIKQLVGEQKIMSSDQWLLLCHTQMLFNPSQNEVSSRCRLKERLLVAKRDLRLLKEAKCDQWRAAYAAVLEARQQPGSVCQTEETDSAILGKDNFGRVG